MEKNEIMYAYIKGSRYSQYSISFEGNEELIAFTQEFKTLEQMQKFIIEFSNCYSIPVQYYM